MNSGTIAETYGLATDMTDWPTIGGNPLPAEEKDAIKAIVLRVLESAEKRGVGLSTPDLVDLVSSHPDLRNTALASNVLRAWTFGVVVRAARAINAEQRWHAPSTHNGGRVTGNSMPSKAYRVPGADPNKPLLRLASAQKTQASAHCPSKWNSNECALPVGHSGLHDTCGGFTIWPDVADTHE